MTVPRWTCPCGASGERVWSGESGVVDGGALGSGDAKFAYLTFLIWPDLT